MHSRFLVRRSLDGFASDRAVLCGTISEIRARKNERLAELRSQSVSQPARQPGGGRTPTERVYKNCILSQIDYYRSHHAPRQKTRSFSFSFSEVIFHLNRLSERRIDPARF